MTIEIWIILMACISFNICAIFYILDVVTCIIRSYSGRLPYIESINAVFSNVLYVFGRPILLDLPALRILSSSEDYKDEIIQSLFSKSVSLLQVVLTKLFSVYTMFIIFWRAPLYFLIFDIQNSHIMNYCSMIMSYYIFRASLFIALDGMFFISIDIFPSSMSKNQLVSCMMKFFSLLEFFIDRQIFSNCSKLSNTGFWGTSSGTLYIFHTRWFL